MTDSTHSMQRRKLIVATSAAGGIGAAIAAVPFVASLQPSARARAAGAPVEADIGRLAPGQMLTVEWRGKPVWILHRTAEMLGTLPGLVGELVDPDSRQPQQPEYCCNPHRSLRPEIFVAVGICTHLGCSPSSKFRHGEGEGMPADWDGGFLCPCHGSTFDFAGRVFKNKPAPDNLEIPPHRYLTETRLLIGEDATAA